MEPLYKKNIFKNPMLRYKTWIIIGMLVLGGSGKLVFDWWHAHKLARTLKASRGQRAEVLWSTPRDSYFYEKSLERLIDDEVIDLKSSDKTEEAADILISLINTRHKVLVRKMLDKGVDPTLPNDIDDYPILAAARAGDPEIIDLLIRFGVSADFTDSYNGSPLRSAARSRNKSVIEHLLRKGATKNINFPDSDGMTPLDWAYYWVPEMGDAPDVSGLLIQAGALTSDQIRKHQAALAQIQTGQKVHQ